MYKSICNLRYASLGHKIELPTLLYDIFSLCKNVCRTHFGGVWSRCKVMRIRNAKRLKGYSTSSLTLYDMCVLHGVSILFSFSFFFALPGGSRSRLGPK